MERSIIHVDMDAFFVSCELLERPELRGRPVIVGGTGDRGVVAAASYEARSYGVRSAMPSVTARRLCPDAVFLAGRHGRYGEISAQVMAIFARVTPAVEPLSLDEAFLDVTGSVRALGRPRIIAEQIRAAVADEVGLTCSVGIAPNKFLAKLASERAKPRPSRSGPVFGPGIFEVHVGEELAFLHPLPAEALWGVGPATLAKLARLGIVTVGDLAAMPPATLCSALGTAAGTHLHELANGRDDRPVVADLRPKSVSHEETFAVDRHDHAALDVELVRMADAVGTRLRSSGIGGRTVGIKVRFSTFETITRSRTFAEPVDDGLRILTEARALLDEVDVGRGVRLLGVGVSNLTDDVVQQLSFDIDAGDVVDDPVRRDATNRAVDEIRRRFGADAIGPARLAEQGGPCRFVAGQQQWGPTGEPGDRP